VRAEDQAVTRRVAAGAFGFLVPVLVDGVSAHEPPRSTFP